MPEPVHPDDVDSGAVLPLYLNLVETRVLAVAVELAWHLDEVILTDPVAAASADERDVGRADQVRAAARERAAILRSLSTALAEHQTSLELSMELDEADGVMRADPFGNQEAAP